MYGYEAFSKKPSPADNIIKLPTNMSHTKTAGARIKHIPFQNQFLQYSYYLSIKELPIKPVFKNNARA